jgi:hypothetical protein
MDAEEIGVTDEMEAAGIMALSGLDPESDSPSEIAIRIFRAMAAAGSRNERRAH